MTEVCGIILAAGKSTRMSSMKQLLPWEDKALLEYQISRLATLSLKEVIVVLGHEAERIRDNINIKEKSVKFIICHQYEEGLSASVKCALSYASSYYSSVLLLLADLPLLQLETIKMVLGSGTRQFQLNNKPFSVQPKYGGRRGHPVFIGHFQRMDWRSLQGDTGAKGLIEQLERQVFFNTNDIGTIFDIDTEAAYKQALQMANSKKEVI